ncbi:MAG: hypothetical protein DLM58_19135 [Pseudonocardiales bacterium]|nr:MAG: hypothetical protein DLM58_19135 [Pseudonocardiales bacterium]
MLAEPTADPAAARRSLDALGITPVVDRLVSVRSDTSGASTAVRMALAVVILLIGIATLVVALAHRDRDTERGPVAAGDDAGRNGPAADDPRPPGASATPNGHPE